MTMRKLAVLLLVLVLIAKGMSWVAIVLGALWAGWWLLGELRLFLWRMSLKDPKARMEAQILVQSYRASKRR